MRRWFLAAFLLLTACAGLPAAAPEVQRAAAQPEPTCETLRTFSDGGVLLYCPPGTQVPDDVASETPVPPDTETAVPTDTSAPPTVTPKPSRTPTDAPSATAAPSDTPAPTDTPTAVPSATVTAVPLTLTPTALPQPTVTTGAAIAPFKTAPLCPDHLDLHDVTKFHTLWDSARGCHYDHEHGRDPFTAEVAAAFPGFDLLALNCGVQVGHCNPSSPIENSVIGGKHGGMKYDVNLATFQGCAGFEGATIGVNAAVMQYHNFGDYSVELNGRIHSASGLLRQCKAGAPNDYGYVYTVGWQDYGQRTVPYQGDIMPYPDNPAPYDPPRGPYVSFDCFGQKAADTPPERGVCRPSLQYVLDRNANANSIWTSKPTGTGPRPQPFKVFQLLFRIRDTYQLVDWADQVYPFTFGWLCSNDGGATYAAKVGCRYNNSTSHVHEIAGEIPAAWDGQPWDTDSRVGRVTGEGYVGRYGDWVPAGACVQPGATCFPIKLVSAFVGKYGSQLIDGKFQQFSVEGQPERDIYFCGAVVCAETASGAQASGWVGPNN